MGSELSTTFLAACSLNSGEYRFAFPGTRSRSFPGESYWIPCPETVGHLTHRLRGRVAAGGAQAPMRLFHLSIVYLTLLFAAVAITALLPWHTL